MASSLFLSLRGTAFARGGGPPAVELSGGEPSDLKIRRGRGGRLTVDIHEGGGSSDRRPSRVDARYAKLLLANASDHPALRDLHIWTHVYRVTSKTHALTKVTTEAARKPKEAEGRARGAAQQEPNPKEAVGSRRKPKEAERRGPRSRAAGEGTSAYQRK